jgi:hypothetical protein
MKLSAVLGVENGWTKSGNQPQWDVHGYGDIALLNIHLLTAFIIEPKNMLSSNSGCIMYPCWMECQFVWKKCIRGMGDIQWVMHRTRKQTNKNQHTTGKAHPRLFLKNWRTHYAQQTIMAIQQTKYQGLCSLQTFPKTGKTLL